MGQNKACTECYWWSKPIMGWQVHLQSSPAWAGLASGSCPVKMPQGLPQMNSFLFLSSFCWEMFKTTSMWIIVGSETLGDSSDCFIKIQGTNWAVLNSHGLSYIFWASDLNSQIFYFYKKELVFAGQDSLYVNPCRLFSLLNSKCPFPPKPMERWPLAPSLQIY